MNLCFLDFCFFLIPKDRTEPVLLRYKQTDFPDGTPPTTTTKQVRAAVVEIARRGKNYCERASPWGPRTKNQDQGPGTRDHGPGPGSMDQGPGTEEDQDEGPWTRDQGSGPGTWDLGPGNRDQGPGTMDQDPWRGGSGGVVGFRRIPTDPGGIHRSPGSPPDPP